MSDSRDKTGASRSVDAFKAAPPSHQELIREILAEERKVMHKQRRPNIQQTIYETVKRIIK